MRLEKLTEQTVQHLHLSKICCYGCSTSYFLEFEAMFHLMNAVQCIIDDGKRRQGEYVWNERGIPVIGLTEFVQSDFFSNSVIIIMDDYFQEIFERISESISDDRVVYYFTNHETDIEEDYRLRYLNTPLQNSILFRSGPHAEAYVKGMDFSDNARALFEYLLANGYNSRYKLIWLVKNPDDYTNYANIPNVEFLSFNWSISESRQERDSYYQALCLAKYIFFTDAYGFARNCRKDQIRVQLWHGCGFKTRVNFVRCEKRYEYTTVISELYAEIHQEIYGLRENQMLVTGYAKEDWLFSPVIDFIDALSLPRAKKYIFWLPTFRMAKKELDTLDEYELESQTGLPVVDTVDKLQILDKLLQEKKIVLVIKLHPFQNRSGIEVVSDTNIVLLDNDELFEKDIEINRLLGCADALISDYSSAAVDYMILDRPIAFTLDDVDKYESSRGFIFENIRDWLPGKQIDTFEDFCEFVNEISDGKDLACTIRQKLKRKMHKYGDDKNCERIINALKL